MTHLAVAAGASCTSREIAGATGVPRSYLSKIMRSLVRASLVRSCRGKHGGFRLARDPAVVSVLDIATAIDPIRPPGYSRFHRCLNEAQLQMEQVLRVTTLATVARTVGDQRVDPRKLA
ncbi:MAG: Rrf2 family transcriptional regulator [Phycisphaerales bacterium]|nr:Rrf2 family transcriptional regulator [Phycisphaerales bacterium]